MRKRARISTRAARVGAMFGVEARGGPPPWSAAVARRLDEALGPGGVALVTGPSGSGKSAILRSLVMRLRLSKRRVVVAGEVRGARAKRAGVELVDGPLAKALQVLARAGLAEAPLLVTPAAAWSEGQRARLWIAWAMARAATGVGATIVIDEFASTLDRATAMALARSLRRWATKEGRVRVVCATAHDDLLEALGPDVLVEQPLGAPAAVHTRGAA